MATLEPLMRDNFLEYASYVVTDRAIPDLRDGLKPVQRRILHTLFEMDDGRFHKVANVIGETMKLHPHGDAAIGDALVVLANKGYFIERQGNFGNPFTGHSAAAARYIECRLTPLARETLFHPALTTFVPSYDGRKDEPRHLPARLPVLLLLGPEGIAVGMATRILPHNLGEVLRAQIALLQGREARVLPDFPHGGVMDATEYDDGRGRVTVRARIEQKNDKTLVLREIPYGTTTESVIASIEAAAAKGQVKIGSIHDYTTESVEIEIQLPRGVYAGEVLPQLFAWTDCQVVLNSSITAIVERRPCEMRVSEVLGFLTDQLLAQVKAELEHELGQLEDKRHFLTLERIFVERRVYKKIEHAKTDPAVRKAVWDGMHEHALYFARPMVEDDVDRLLAIRIRRISAFDIQKHKEDLEAVETAIRDRQKKLKNLKKTAIAWLEGLLERHGEAFPRRTEIADSPFEAVDKKAVARQDLRVSYDPETGFFGTKVRGSAHALTVSAFDKILCICQDGTWRVIGVEEKLLLPGKVLWLDVLDPDEGREFTVVYRDAERRAFGKRVVIKSFIRDKVYSLIKGEKGRIDLLLTDAKPGRVQLEFVPMKRQRVKEAEFDLDTLEVTAVAARGTRLAPKPVARLRRM